MILVPLSAETQTAETQTAETQTAETQTAETQMSLFPNTSPSTDTKQDTSTETKQDTSTGTTIQPNLLNLGPITKSNLNILQNLLKISDIFLKRGLIKESQKLDEIVEKEYENLGK